MKNRLRPAHTPADCEGLPRKTTGIEPYPSDRPAGRARPSVFRRPRAISRLAVDLQEKSKPSHREQWTAIPPEEPATAIHETRKPPTSPPVALKIPGTQQRRRGEQPTEPSR